MNKEYDYAAKLYDPLFYIFLNPIRKAVAKELIEFKEHSIIDICCGTGNQLKLLAKNGFTSLHCLDLSDSMLKIAANNEYNLKIYNEDATKTPFDNEAFDVGIISFAIHEKNYETQLKLLKEAHRIIKKNGMLLIVDFDFDINTSVLSKSMITMIERLAGQEHYNNFKNYTKNNGLSNLLDENSFQLLKKNKRAFNGIAIATYRRV